MKKTLIIIPTFNESETIETIIDSIFKQTLNCDVLIVDDDSPDETSKIVKFLQKKYKNLHLITKKTDKGFSKAYLTGFEHALKNEKKYDRVIQMDADGSHQPQFISQLLQKLDEGCDYVIGSRWVDGGKVVNWPVKRKILSKGGNWYARNMLKTNIKDVTGGFKAIKINMLKTMMSEPLTTEGYSFQIELFLRARKMEAKICETPITFIEREEGQSKMSQKIVLEAIKYVTREGVKIFVNRKNP